MGYTMSKSVLVINKTPYIIELELPFILYWPFPCKGYTTMSPLHISILVNDITYLVIHVLLLLLLIQFVALVRADTAVIVFLHLELQLGALHCTKSSCLFLVGMLVVNEYGKTENEKNTLCNTIHCIIVILCSQDDDSG